MGKEKGTTNFKIMKSICSRVTFAILETVMSKGVSCWKGSGEGLPGEKAMKG